MTPSERELLAAVFEAAITAAQRETLLLLVVVVLFTLVLSALLPRGSSQTAGSADQSGFAPESGERVPSDPAEQD